MIGRILTVGLLAGLVAGLAFAVLAHFTTVPLILQAETYELAGVATHDHGAAQGDASGPDASGHDATAAWSPADGLERTAFTAVASIVSAIGFALLLIAVMLLADEEITPRRALAYAAGAFAATGLATGLGLAPELPGSAYVDIVARQSWWFGTAIATAAGLWLLVKSEATSRQAIGAALVIAPHVIGAPHAEGFTSPLPAELAAHFAATSLATQAALWLMIGAAVGLFWQRTARDA